MGLELSWIGGFFDGEGYFGITIKKNLTRRLHFEIIPTVSISSTEKSVLIQIQKELKMGKIVLSSKAHGFRKDLFYWFVRYRRAREFALKIQPFLVLKRETCKRFLELMDKIKNRDTSSVSDFLEITELRDHLNNRHRTYKYRHHSFFCKYFAEHSLPKNFAFRDENGRFTMGHPSVNKGKKLTELHRKRISESNKNTYYKKFEKEDSIWA